MDIDRIIKNQNPTNVWNLKAKNSKETQFSLIAQLNHNFLSEFSYLFKLCLAIVQWPFSKIFTENIASLLKAAQNLEDYSKQTPDSHANSLETYKSHLMDIHEIFSKIKKMASSDTAGGSETNSQISLLRLNIEEERDNDDDYNIESKNQEVDEYNVLDDSITFCNRVIDRLESRLFGYGERSCEQEVEDLMQKARSRERLATMYEGWMPWI